MEATRKRVERGEQGRAIMYLLFNSSEHSLLGTNGGASRSTSAYLYLLVPKGIVDPNSVGFFRGEDPLLAPRDVIVGSIRMDFPREPVVLVKRKEEEIAVEVRVSERIEGRGNRGEGEGNRV